MILGHLSMTALKRMTPEDRIRTIARELKKMEPRKRKRVAQALFGKTSASMMLAGMEIE